jgi:cystathionine beta-lyase
MNYDLEHGLALYNTDCIKWDECHDVFGSDDLLPMWIADMDFPISKPVTEALMR